jgi:hypothetical protein
MTGLWDNTWPVSGSVGTGGFRLVVVVVVEVGAVVVLEVEVEVEVEVEGSDDVVGVDGVGLAELLVRVLGTVAERRLLACWSGCPPHAESTATIAVAADRPTSHRRP